MSIPKAATDSRPINPQHLGLEILVSRPNLYNQHLHCPILGLFPRHRMCVTLLNLNPHRTILNNASSHISLQLHALGLRTTTSSLIRHHNPHLHRPNLRLFPRHRVYVTLLNLSILSPGTEIRRTTLNNASSSSLPLHPLDLQTTISTLVRCPHRGLRHHQMHLRGYSHRSLWWHQINLRGDSHHSLKCYQIHLKGHSHQSLQYLQIYCSRHSHRSPWYRQIHLRWHPYRVLRSHQIHLRRGHPSIPLNLNTTLRPSLSTEERIHLYDPLVLVKAKECGMNGDTNPVVRLPSQVRPYICMTSVCSRASAEVAPQTAPQIAPQLPVVPNTRQPARPPQITTVPVPRGPSVPICRIQGCRKQVVKDHKTEELTEYCGEEHMRFVVVLYGLILVLVLCSTSLSSARRLVRLCGSVSVFAQHVISFLDALAESIAGYLANDGQRNSASSSSVRSSSSSNSNSNVRSSRNNNVRWSRSSNGRASSSHQPGTHTQKSLASHGAMSPQAGRLRPIVYHCHNHMSDEDSPTGRGVLDRPLPQYTLIDVSMNIISS